jgi:peptide deformylase
MALLPILEFPDERLRKKAKPVEAVTPEITRLVEDMLETMYAAPGIGLAATQVNVPLRILVMDLSENKDEPLVLINPELVGKSGAEESEEGCLSVPGFYEKVTRAESVEVRGLDRNGEPLKMEANGLLAVCIQHEMDHLEGKLFVDYLSPLKRQLARRKVKKEQRTRATPSATDAGRVS